MKIVSLGLLVVLAAGCASQQRVDWNATGGSRADATVEVGYQYNPVSVIPVTDRAQSNNVARKRCEAWGYSDAEPFGVERSQCQQTGTGIYDGVCIDKWVTLQYQCLGRGDS